MTSSTALKSEWIPIAARNGRNREGRLAELTCWEAFGGKPYGIQRARAAALGRLAKPRVGDGNQIRYLRLRVAPPGLRVNALHNDF